MRPAKPLTVNNPPTMRWFVGILAAGLFLVGCQNQKPAGSANGAVKSAVNYYYVDADQQASGKAGHSNEDPSKVAAAPGSDAVDDLDKLKAEQAQAEKALKSAPTDEKIKKDYVIKTVRLGTACMESPDLDSKVKYRTALQYYRQAMKVDPNNVEAKNNSSMIIAIYHQLHRPVPE